MKGPRCDPTLLTALAGALCLLASAGALGPPAAAPTVLQNVRIIDGQGGAPLIAMGMDQVYRPATIAAVREDFEKLWLRGVPLEGAR